MKTKRLTKNHLAILAFLLQGCSCLAQDYTWWNTTHNWDNSTHWHRYITISPAFMGPNALPVPAIKNGILDKKSSFTFAVDKHVSRGDKTENIFTRLYLPLFSDRVGLNIQMVPWEHYHMTVTTRDERKARDFDGKGTAIGDLYLGTYIQLVENKAHFPDVLLTINLKTASGSNLAAARFTDAPAYHFDVSFGKKITAGNSTLQIRPHTMIGLYIWQTFRNDYNQNDAFLYGLGVDLLFPKLAFSHSMGGYVGYIGNGDRPMIYRMRLASKLDSIYNYELNFQQGIFDFQYSTFRIACKIDLEKLKIVKAH